MRPLAISAASEDRLALPCTRNLATSPRCTCSCAEALCRVAPHVADNSIPQHPHVDYTLELPPDAEPSAAATTAAAAPSELLSPSRKNLTPPKAAGSDAGPALPTRSGSPDRRLAAAASRGMRRSTTLTDRMAQVLPQRPETAAEESAAVATLRTRAAEDAALLRGVGEVAVAIHGQAQELLRQMGLLVDGVSLPLSKVGAWR